MPNLTLEQARQKRQQRQALAWIGGCGFVLVLAVVQLVLLQWWITKSTAAKMAQIEKRMMERARTEHPALPPWVPVYPGGVPKGAAGPDAGEVALAAEEPPERVLDFYDGRLRANGFAVEPRTEQAGVFTLKGRRVDGREVTVQSGEGSKGTWIVVNYKAPTRP